MNGTSPPPHGARLISFTRTLTGVATLFAAAELSAALALREPRLVLSTLALVLTAVIARVARRWAQRDAVTSAASLLGYGILVTLALSAFALPFAYPTLSFTALLALVVVLPYLEGTALNRMAVSAFVTLGGVTLNGLLRPPPAELPAWVFVLTNFFGLGAAAGLALVLLLQFSARLRHAVGEITRAREQALFLAQASALLAETLDLEPTLSQLGQLAVSRLADWFTVSVVGEDGSLKRLEVATRDPSLQKRLEEYRTRFPPEKHRGPAYASVLQSGKPIFLPVVTDERLAEAAQDADHLALLRDLGVSSCMVVPMLAHGQALGVLAFIRTKPDRPYAHSDLEMAQDLAARAALAVENARLYEKERKAVQLRDEFLSVAGHEMKTPLTALQIQMQGLLRSVEPLGGTAAAPEVATWVRRTVVSGERLVRLVEDLLDVTRISSGRLMLHPEPLDLVPLLREVAGRYEEAAVRAEAPLQLSLPESVTGKWDAQRLEQVVSNLISNGLKYGKGSPVELSATSDDAEVVLRVRDGGIGISAEDQARIFQRFERAVSTRHYGGLGLGLWIVHQIVSALGGSIRVESALGQGATFIVTLPRNATAPG